MSVRGIPAWASERFPASHVVMFAVLYVMVAAAARSLSGPGRLVFGPGDLLVLLALTGFFLQLRVFDELKDADDDAIAHPERAFQRGIVTRRDLGFVLAAAYAAQVPALVALDETGRATAWWGAGVIWALLMRHEFFAAGWLRPRLLPYAALHMLVMPLVILWLASLALRGSPLPDGIGAVAALGFVSGAGFEVARKLRAPGDEHPLAPTYTQSLGVRGASLVLIAVLAANALLGSVVLTLAGALGAAAIAALALIGLWGILAVLAFARGPGAANALSAGKLATLACLLVLVVIAAALTAARGAAWS